MKFDWKGFGKAVNQNQNALASIIGVRQSQISKNTQSGVLTEGNYKKLVDAFGNDIVDQFVIAASKFESVATMVPLLPMSAMGGGLNDFVVSVMEHDCEKIVTPIKDVDFAITIAGESMAPEYPNGSVVFIKRINEAAFIDWGKAYVLDTVNGVVVKILTPSNKKNYVRCVSINPDPIYAPFDILMSDIRGIYRIKLCMSIK